MKELEKYGFTKIGEWVSSNHASTKHLSKMKGINFILPKEIKVQRNVSYAFVVNNQIIYLGETTRGLGSRFEGYRYGNTNEKDTDNRIKIAITHSLDKGRSVEIWYVQPTAKYQLDDGTELDVPASKPLEEHLIKIFNPELNVKNLNK